MGIRPQFRLAILIRQSRLFVFVHLAFARLVDIHNRGGQNFTLQDSGSATDGDHPGNCHQYEAYFM